MLDKQYNNRSLYTPNLMKMCKLNSSPIAGTVGKVGKIVGIEGHDIEGYRYKVEFSPPIGVLDHIHVLYPPVFSVDFL